MKPAIEAPSSFLKQASLVAFEREENSFPWNWHYHPELELTLIVEGRGTRLVGDHSEAYGPGDLVLLGANLPHTWFSFNRKEAVTSGSNRAIVVQFRHDMLPAGLLALPEFAAIGQLMADAARGLRFPATAAQEIQPELCAPGWLGLVNLFGRLAQMPRSMLASPGHRHRSSARMSSRMERVITHLEKHYRDDLPVAQVARMLGLSSGTFSRFFRKMAQQTFVDYRNGLRVREACRLLEESDLPVTEIAYECGFNNLANFNRRFRAEKGMSPRYYRQLHNPTTGS
jgi:AraC-like DNA-binding protein